MTNSINPRKNFLTPDKAASFIPVFISAGISILIVTFIVMPQYIKSNKVNFELMRIIHLNFTQNKRLWWNKVICFFNYY